MKRLLKSAWSLSIHAVSMGVFESYCKSQVGNGTMNDPNNLAKFLDKEYFTLPNKMGIQGVWGYALDDKSLFYLIEFYQFDQIKQTQFYNKYAPHTVVVGWKFYANGRYELQPIYCKVHMDTKADSLYSEFRNKTLPINGHQVKLLDTGEYETFKDFKVYIDSIRK